MRFQRTGKGLDSLQEEVELELVSSLADSEDEDEPTRPLSLELLPVGPVSEAPVFNRSSARPWRFMSRRSREMRELGRSEPVLLTDVAPMIGNASKVDGRRQTAAQRMERMDWGIAVDAILLVRACSPAEVDECVRLDFSKKAKLYRLL